MLKLIFLGFLIGIGLFIYWKMEDAVKRKKIEEKVRKNLEYKEIERELKEEFKGDFKSKAKNKKEFYKADYIKNDFLITPTEKEFLRQFNKEKLDFMEVSLQVRLADVIESKNIYDFKAFEQIKALSLDYVIYEKESYRILFIIELDDPSHYKQSRQLNDYIKDYALKSAKIPFFRVKTKTDYLDDIEKIIFSYENIY